MIKSAAIVALVFTLITAPIPLHRNEARAVEPITTSIGFYYLITGLLVLTAAYANREAISELGEYVVDTVSQRPDWIDFSPDLFEEQEGFETPIPGSAELNAEMVGKLNLLVQSTAFAKTLNILSELMMRELAIDPSAEFSLSELDDMLSSLFSRYSFQNEVMSMATELSTALSSEVGEINPTIQFIVDTEGKPIGTKRVARQRVGRCLEKFGLDRRRLMAKAYFGPSAMVLLLLLHFNLEDILSDSSSYSLIRLKHLLTSLGIASASAVLHGGMNRFFDGNASWAELFQRCLDGNDDDLSEEMEEFIKLRKKAASYEFAVHWPLLVGQFMTLSADLEE